jgi:hypothetical protein
MIFYSYFIANEEEENQEKREEFTIAKVPISKPLIGKRYNCRVCGLQ